MSIRPGNGAADWREPRGVQGGTTRRPPYARTRRRSSSALWRAIASPVLGATIVRRFLGARLDVFATRALPSAWDDRPCVSCDPGNLHESRRRDGAFLDPPITARVCSWPTYLRSARLAHRPASVESQRVALVISIDQEFRSCAVCDAAVRQSAVAARPALSNYLPRKKSVGVSPRMVGSGAVVRAASDARPEACRG